MEEMTKRVSILIVVIFLIMTTLLTLLYLTSRYSEQYYNTETDKIFDCDSGQEYMTFCDEYYDDKIKCVQLYNYERLKRCSE